MLCKCGKKMRKVKMPLRDFHRWHQCYEQGGCGAIALVDDSDPEYAMVTEYMPQLAERVPYDESTKSGLAEREVTA